jgi:predicted RNA binding protein YcfA (HicA-like mRNA interferase family)
MAGQGLPVISGANAVRAFERDGWKIRAQVGSHLAMTKGGASATLSIPQHKELRPGTLRSLIRLAGLTVDEFRTLLNS